MKFPRIWVVAVLAALAAGTAYLLARRSDPEPRRAQSARAAPSVDTPPTTVHAPPADPPARKAADPPRVDTAIASTDPFDLIRSLARRAYDGDGKAQYRISRELDRCEMTLSLIRKERDPEAAIWGWGTNWTPSMKEWAVGEYHRCKRLLTEDPFAELPKRDGGYKFQYWFERSVEAGYSMAVSRQALSNLSLLRAGGATQKPIDRTTEIDALSNAALSDEPDVLLDMGFNLWMRQDPNTSTRGAALMLAACRAGANCGFDSDTFPFVLCYYSGNPECGPGANVESVLSQAAKPEVFAKAYAESQQIEQILRDRDAEAMKRWLDLF